MKTGIVVGLLALLAVAGSLVTSSASGPAADKTPPARSLVMSLQRIAAESTEGRAANQRLQALARKMAGELAAKQKEFAQPTGPEFQRLAQQSQAEFASTQREVQSELRAKVNIIAADIAAQHGADLVLNADSLVWSAGRLDITNEVLARLDAQPPSGK